MGVKQKKYENLLIFSLLLITGVVLFCSTCQAAIQCYQCHGNGAFSDYRPGDAAYRNISTGAFQGNHQTHMTAPAVPAVCVKCHNNQNYISSHRDGKIQFASNINNSPATEGGQYKLSGNAITFKNQTSLPIMGTCSNINCHFEAVTPQWGSAAFTSPTGCNKCHGTPPNGTNGAAGSHGKHDQYYSGIANCQQCHSNNTSFQHATSAGKRPLNISFAAAPNNGSGSYYGALNDYLPSQTNVFGTCTNLYCHSPGTKSTPPFTAPLQIPTWGGGSLSCSACHGTPPTATGSHTQHVLTTKGVPVPCYKCHAATVNSSMTISTPANHVNGYVTIAFGSSTTAVSGKYSSHATPYQKKPGSGPGNCEQVYCHSNGQNNGGTWPPTYSQPVWGTPATGKCGTCHATGYHGDTGPKISSGSHTKHLNNGLGFTSPTQEICGICHYGNGQASASCATACHNMSDPAASNLARNHVNGKINVSFVSKFGGTYNGSGKPGNNYSGSTCNNVYCHSDGLGTPNYTFPQWGSPSSGACGSCHGVSAGNPPSSSSPHTKHLGSSNPYLFACANCHYGYVQATANSSIAPTYTNTTSHVNKLRDVRFGPTNPFGTYSTATQSCRNMYCHSIGNTSIVAGSLPGAYNGKIYARQTWSGSVSCNSCHGRSTSNGKPDYTDGGIGTTANTHGKHVDGSSISCGTCHNRTTKDSSTIRANIFPSSHVNGSRDVFFDLSSNAAQNGSYDSSQKTCNNIVCHSNARGSYQQPKWGESDNCNYCHPIANLGGAHTKHVDLSQTVAYYTYTANRSTTAAYSFGCSSCHPLTAGSSHATGTIILDLRPSVANIGTLRAKNANTISAAGPAGTTNGGTTADSTSGSVVKCLNIYCHSNGYTSNLVFSTTPNWYGGTFSGDKCANCHGNSPNSTVTGSPSHFNSNFAGSGNPGGHVVGIHYDNIFNGTVGTATPGTSATSSHGNPTTSTTLNCNTCHYATVSGSNNDKNIVCTTCHTGGSARSDAVITNKAKHVNGVPDIEFNPIQIRSKAQILPADATVWTRNGDYKTSGSFDIANTSLNTATMWNGTTKTCSNISCHFNNPINWEGNTGIAAKCTICHDSL